MPTLSTVIAVDSGVYRRMMAVPACPECQPDRYNQSPFCYLDTMSRAGRDNAPRVIRAVSVQSRRDIGSRGKCLPVIIAPHVKDAHVFAAKEQMNRSALVGDHHRIVVRDVVRFALLALERNRTSRNVGRVCNHLLWRKRLAAVGTSSHDDVDGVPVAARVSACFRVRENRACLCNNDAWNAVDLVPALP